MKKELPLKNDGPFAPGGNWWEFISEVSALNMCTVKEKIILGHNVCDFLGDKAGENFPPCLREDLLKPLLALENAYKIYVESPKSKLEREVMRFYEKLFDVAYMAFVASLDETNESGPSARALVVNIKTSQI